MIGVRTEPLPITGEFPPLFALMGAHGGAGTTTPEPVTSSARTS